MTNRSARMRRGTRLVLGLVFIGLVVAALAACDRQPVQKAADAPRWSNSMTDHFGSDSVIYERKNEDESASSTWWLGSGARLTMTGGTARTIQGDSPHDYYRRRYAERNPRDSDGGAHPQNLFRVVTRGRWTGDVREQVYFRINDYHVSSSPQRYNPNGVLLFSRYTDQDNLYYAGIRVDGHAIVKKKSNGVYYTLAEKPVFDGEYDRDSNPILLPKHRWLGLRSVTRELPDGSVSVSLYVDEDRSGRWKLLLEGIDAGVGGDPFKQAGRAGIRTDFMDVEFDDYSVSTAQ